MTGKMFKAPDVIHDGVLGLGLHLDSGLAHLLECKANSGIVDRIPGHVALK
jgi:hypothetical protein